MARLKFPNFFQKKETQEVNIRQHKNLVAADPFAFQASHRRLAWSLRISAGTNVILVAALMVMANTISVLLPLKETKIALVRTYAPDDKLYRIEPISEKVEGFELLLESKAHRFVKLALDIDEVTQKERMNEISHMVTPSFGKKYRRKWGEPKAIREALDNGLERQNLIESVDKIESFGNDHKLVVDFMQVDRHRNKVTNRNKLRAYLSLTTRPNEVREEERYTNPLGIVVLDMTLKERDQP
ncbi:MAG: VirB8/TrbF family protein [Alphaproteobacteria bacterium]|nr:VirB8/TrbF family protein [Rhodospirillales bacterium]MCW9045311.1 VirB8/TrbF family protein [Alphaproteobacteria bacterium]